MILMILIFFLNKKLRSTLRATINNYLLVYLITQFKLRKRFIITTNIWWKKPHHSDLQSDFPSIVHVSGNPNQVFRAHTLPLPFSSIQSQCKHPIFFLAFNHAIYPQIYIIFCLHHVMDTRPLVSL